MKHAVHRSMLILPVNVRRFVEKAHARGADAIVLDLEDSIPPDEKAKARSLVKESLAVAGQGGADVIVRVNNEPDLIAEDMSASVHNGLHALFVPKVESAQQIRELSNSISELEEHRGLAPESVKIDIHIESPLGILDIREIVAASSRIESASIGVDDYCMEMGIVPTEDATELLFPFSMLAIASKAAGVNPIGILGTVANFKDLAVFERAAVKAKQLGATGAYCIHPDQVSILNRVFFPSQEAVEWAGRVVRVFEEALNAGRASTSLDGKMIDTPVYKRAIKTLEQAGQSATPQE